MMKLFRTLSVSALALTAAPLLGQENAAPPPIGGPRVEALAPAAFQSARGDADQRWMKAFEEERERVEVTRARWIYPVAGAALGGLAGATLGWMDRSDYMGPVGLPVILGTLGVAGGALVGWYVDETERLWDRQRREREERERQPRASAP